MSDLNYVFELHDFDEALTPYGTIETKPPSAGSLEIEEFIEGDHFRTATEDQTADLILQLEDRNLNIILDESGSMTWNDNAGDRYVYLKRLLNKLNATYPGAMTANLIGFGGVPTNTKLFITKSGTDFLTSEGYDLQEFLQATFEDSVYDFSGVRVVRRSDRYPTHPADGIVVSDGIIDAVKDDQLTEDRTYYYGIWTYNKDNHFSAGQFIQATPRDRILPQGVNFFSATPRILPGVERDSYTQIIYNFTERSGFVVFDSSLYGRHGVVGPETIETGFWAGDSASNSFDGTGEIKSPTGVRFDGSFDIIETDINQKFSIIGQSHNNAQAITVNFWLFRYQQDTQAWIAGTSSDTPSSDVGWAVGISPNGNVLLEVDSSISSGFSVVTNAVVPEKTWTMVTVVFETDGTAKIYIDSELSHTITVSDSNIETPLEDKLYIGAKPTSSGASWSGIDYFGSLGQFSISNTSRPQSWITETYSQESDIFSQNSRDEANDPIDNLQREVLLSWNVGEDYNFSGGTIKIIRKYRSVPSHDNDGDVIYTSSSSSGQFYFLDPHDFVHNADYYYRIFTYNSLGNACDRSEARVFPVFIPKSTFEIDTTIPPVSSETITPGSKKLFLQWSNPSDARWKGVKVLYGSRQFPTISRSSQGDIQITDGVEILDTTKSSFTHRSNGIDCNGTDISLNNGSPHYYSIYSYDVYGHVSNPVYIMGMPSSELDTNFLPDDVKNLYPIILNPKTISLKWDNPTIKNQRLDLYFGESALIFVSIKDIYGGDLTDIDNLRLKVCTKITERGITTTESTLNSSEGFGDFSDVFDPDMPCEDAPMRGGRAGGSGFGAPFDENCNSEEENHETSLTYAPVESGLIKGVVTHINDKALLARRQRYVMNIFAQYRVEDTNREEDTENPDSRNLFKFITKPVSVTFTHPIRMSLINKLRKFASEPCGTSDEPRRLDEVCTCNEILNEGPCQTKSFNGGYVKANVPYVCRVEVQYKGGSLPEGTPVNVGLFKHENGNPLRTRSDRTFITEGRYETVAIQEEELDGDGNPTGRFVSKSVVDIEVPHPQLPDYVDLYVTIDYGGFLLDAVHEIKFLSTLFIRADVNKPFPDGIDISEQFATVWQLDPDDPFNEDANIPVPDGTVVKWTLEPLRHGRNRPFFSTERLPVLISGVYSTTTSGVTRSVFFGPVANLESHIEQISCNDEEGNLVAAESCCLSEEYQITASVILDEESVRDSVIIAYACNEESSRFSNRRFLMNAAPSQPGSNPHWITWADGEHLLKFQIAQNPALSTMMGADCFRHCVEAQVGGQLFPFSDEQIVQVSAPSEILWDVTFSEDPYTGELSPVSYQIARPPEDDEYGTHALANIPIRGSATDFYLRINKFVKDNNPKPEECESGSGGGAGGGAGEEGPSPCEWNGLCDGISVCSPTSGNKWVNVGVVSGTATLIANNTEITLFGGGDYDTGIPPVYVGFKEPLSVRVIEARINGARVGELVVDGFSSHTFVVEVLFAGEPVPDGTPVEISVEGEDQDVIIPNASVIYTRQINDPLINPEGNQRSLAFFSIDPIPNISFSAKINTTCRYDKLGVVSREIVACVELSNTVNIQPPTDNPEGDGSEPITESSVSNETIIYDTVQDSHTTTTSCLVSRMGHFSIGTILGTMDHIYNFGGWTGNSNSGTSSITALSEIFNLTSQKWAFTTDMPTARCYGMVVHKGETIYCIGGIEFDPLLSQNSVSRKIESFDISTETWNTTLSPMPEGYGVAYGDAQVVGDYIYVTCGINTITDNSKPGDLNDKILRYSIPEDSWDIITPSNLSLYKRITPFGFYRNGAANDLVRYYIYGGSIPKSSSQIESERLARINLLLNQFRSFILTSAYFQNLSPSEQEDFIQKKEEEIRKQVVVPAYVYPMTGFKINPGSEVFNGEIWTINISDTLDDEWTVLPSPRDHGKCCYISHQDVVYFIGGSNQNQSTTLNKIEAIDLKSGNLYDIRNPLSRGRSMFGAAIANDDVYITGGLTSGHREGWVQIDVSLMPEFVESMGTESCGMIITLKNDSGEVIEDDIRVDVRGRLRIEEIDSMLIEYTANRSADRALGGDGSGNAPDAPETGDQINIDQLVESQNSITDPNSDQFQFNAARQLNEQLYLFPVLYSRNDFVINAGIGGTTLKPRSEDPLSDFQKLSEFISSLIENSIPEDNERFTGDISKEQLAALGDVLDSIETPSVTIDSGSLRDLYDIETIVTVLDEFYFGQTVSDLDEAIQERTRDRIEEILTPPAEDEGEGDGQTGGDGQRGGADTVQSPCLVLEHSAQSDIPSVDTPPSNDPNNPSGTGGFSQSGQCQFCESILPLNVDIRDQLSTVLAKFYNVTDWLPQIKNRIITNVSLSTIIDEIDNIDHEIPFGSSQLYDAIVRASQIASAEDIEEIKKSIYIVSDNSQNISVATRNQSIEEVNSIDGDKNAPVIYTVFSTAFPASLSVLLDRTETGDVDKITQQTGGQSSTLIASGFMDYILNLTIGGATGGLGYGIYKRRLDLGELSAITAMTTDFDLPKNTNGFVRFRYSKDGYNFTDFSEKFEGSQFIDFDDLFAKILDLEVVLSTGFSEDITEEYDLVATGIPKLKAIVFNTSVEREDFVFLDTEEVLKNTQQIAMAFEGSIPEASIVELGAATSHSHNWSDFQSTARPAVNEVGKMFMLERTDDIQSSVPKENLDTIDYIRYKSTYGPWDANALVEIFDITSGSEIPVSSGFKLYPRNGEVYFETKQPPNRKFKISIVNENKTRVGMRLRNRLHTDSISIEGVGFIYSTNDDKFPSLSQVAPTAINVSVSPASPTAGDTIFALYSYIDLNNDDESGSVISWYKNGIQLLEVQNIASWTNTSLLPSHRLLPGDRLQFSVTPSDGRNFGTTVFSPSVTIVSRPPGADDVTIVPTRNGVINDRFDTSSIFTVNYTFNIQDEGPNAQENGTIIKWYVNGILFKEGTFPSDDPYLDPKSLQAGEVINGRTAHVIGNQIQAEVTPKTLSVTGETVRSSIKTVENSIAIASNVQIEPLVPNPTSTLSVNYSIDDLDITREIQTDQSEIKWFNSSDGTTYTEVTELRNQHTAPPFYLRAGQYWKAEVRPYDGLDLGDSATSNIVVIQA